MGKRGPKPTRKDIKKLHGSWRGDLPDGFQVKTIIPPIIPAPPPFLRGASLAEWHRVAPNLYSNGLLTDIDATMLGLYCDSYAEYQCETLYLEELRNNPDCDESTLAKWIRLVRRSWSDTCKIAAQFYMTPSDGREILIIPPLKETKAHKWVNKHKEPSKIRKKKK